MLLNTAISRHRGGVAAARLAMIVRLSWCEELHGVNKARLHWVLDSALCCEPELSRVLSRD